MFARVTSHPQSSAGAINIPLIDRSITKETLNSQFPGAVGLKYQIANCWSAVPLIDNKFIVPEGDPLLVVVTNITGARQVLNSSASQSQATWASQVSNLFKTDYSGSFRPRMTAPYSMETRGNVTKPARIHGKDKPPKSFSKTYKVVFITDVELPVMYSRTHVLAEGIFVLASSDNEAMIKSNLLSIIKNCPGLDLPLSSLATDALTILSFASKELSLPCLPEGFEWDGGRLRTNIGQGKLYVLVTPKKELPVATTSLSNDTTLLAASPSSSNVTCTLSASNEPVATTSSSNETALLAASASSLNVTCTLSASNESDLEDFVLVQPKKKRPLRRAALRYRQTLSSIHSYQQTGHTSGSNTLSMEENPTEVIDSDDEELQQVLNESLLSCPEKTPPKMGDIQALLKNYQGKINKFDRQEIIVFRKRVLDSAFRTLKRPSFDVQCKLYVKFSGELGLDHGGPRREFFRLAIHELSANPSIFVGTEKSKIFTHNILNALQEGEYRMAGKLIAMSLAQDGPAVGFLNKDVFMLMAGLDQKLQNFDLTLIPDADVRHILKELHNVDSEGSRDTFLSKYGDWMIEQGIQNVWRLKISDIPMTIHALVKQTIYHRTASEIQQFCKGLNDVCGLMTDIEKNPKAWQTLFCDMGLPLSKEQFLEECDISFSVEGSNRRSGEEETIYSFELFLQNIKEETVPVTFGELLAFITGADNIPPGGFESKIQILFYDQEEGTVRVPFVSTCALNLSLPRNTNPEPLQELLIRALKESMGFGKC